MSTIKPFLHLTPEDNQRLSELCGLDNQHILLIEQYLDIQIENRGFCFNFVGQPDKVDIAKRVVLQIYEHSRSSPINSEEVHLELMSHLETKSLSMFSPRFSPRQFEPTAVKSSQSSQSNLAKSALKQC